MNYVASRIKMDLIMLGFHSIPNHPHIFTWPEFPNHECYIPTETEVHHRLGLLFSVMSQAGVVDLSEIRPDKEWWSEVHGVRLKMTGTPGYSDHKVVIHFSG